jgi:hypothetical protein
MNSCAFDNQKSRRPGMRWLTHAAAVAASALAAVPATATGYNETSGDFSNDGAHPTAVVFGLGDNFITGTTGGSANGPDLDYFTFTIAPGQQLTAILELAGTESIAKPGETEDLARSFIGLEGGPTFDTLPNTLDPSTLLGYAHYNSSLAGTDILDNIAGGAGAQGFTPPLGAGTYSVWIQELNTGTAHYFFNFKIGAVPEPSTWAMMLSGFGLIGWSMRRRAQVRKGPSSARSLAI